MFDEAAAVEGWIDAEKESLGVGLAKIELRMGPLQTELAALVVVVTELVEQT